MCVVFQTVELVKIHTSSHHNLSKRNNALVVVYKNKKLECYSTTESLLTRYHLRFKCSEILSLKSSTDTNTFIITRNHLGLSDYFFFILGDYSK